MSPRFSNIQLKRQTSTLAYDAKNVDEPSMGWSYLPASILSCKQHLHPPFHLTIPLYDGLKLEQESVE
jgi:hypothetical protein